MSDLQLTKVTDEELVESAKAGDREAIAELVGRYEDKVYRLALRIVKQQHDAEDVLQETFINVMRNLSSFKGNSAFGTWIFRVATNQALMLIRKKKRIDSKIADIEIVDIPQMPPVGADWSGSPAASLLHKETVEKMDEAIDGLPESLRVIFVLRDVEGLPASEVAEIMDMSVPAVKSRLHRARLTLRESLSDYFGRERG